ncbi:MAG: hypothetical protein ACYDCJ_12420 [Gammaproteobacteria bacterium]
MREHYKAVGHPTQTRKKPEATEAQDEGALISAVVAAFARFDLPHDGVRRVIAYITDRYMPSDPPGL